MRGCINSILACFLSLLLLFGGTAKEALHAFTGHEDTVHTHWSDGVLQIEKKHHHCDFLSHFLAPFEEAGSTSFSFHSFPQARQVFPVFVPVAVFREVSHGCLRGPPTV